MKFITPTKWIPAGGSLALFLRMSPRRESDSLEDLSDRLHEQSADSTQLAERIASLLRSIEDALSDLGSPAAPDAPGLEKNDTEDSEVGKK